MNHTRTHTLKHTLLTCSYIFFDFFVFFEHFIVFFVVLCTKVGCALALALSLAFPLFFLSLLPLLLLACGDMAGHMGEVFCTEGAGAGSFLTDLHVRLEPSVFFVEVMLLLQVAVRVPDLGERLPAKEAGGRLSHHLGTSSFSASGKLKKLSVCLGSCCSPLLSSLGTSRARSSGLV